MPNRQPEDGGAPVAFNHVLTLQKPVHRAIKFIDVGVFDTEVLWQGGIVPPPASGQLVCGRMIRAPIKAQTRSRLRCGTLAIKEFRPSCWNARSSASTAPCRRTPTMSKASLTSRYCLPFDTPRISSIQCAGRCVRLAWVIFWDLPFLSR